MSATAVLRYNVEVDTRTGVMQAEKVGNAFSAIGQKGQAAAAKCSAGFSGLWGKIISVNQAADLAQKAFRLLTLPLQKIVSVTSQFENLQLQLKTVLGSAEKAKDYFAWILKFSTSTPFQVQGLTEAVIQLEAFGINAQKYLRTFGDAAAGLGTPLKDLAKIMGQIWAKPTAKMEEMLQLTERGVPVFQILQEELGLTAQQVANIGNEGIKGTVVFEALVRGMQERYGGAMEEMSKTWTGLTSTFLDIVRVFVGTVGGPVLDNLKSKLEGILTQVNAWAKDGTLEKWGQQLSSSINSVINTVGNVMKAFWSWKDTIINIGKTVAFIFVTKKIYNWGKEIGKAVNWVKKDFTKLDGAIVGGIGKFKDLKTEGVGTMKAMQTSLGHIASKSQLAAVGMMAIGTAIAAWSMERLGTALSLVVELWNQDRNRHQEEMRQLKAEGLLIKEKLKSVLSYSMAVHGQIGLQETYGKILEIQREAQKKGGVEGLYYLKQRILELQSNQNEDKKLQGIMQGGLAIYQTQLGMVTKLTKENEKEIRTYYIKAGKISELVGIYKNNRGKILENIDAMKIWEGRLKAVAEQASPALKKEIESLLKKLETKRKALDGTTQKVNENNEALEKYAAKLKLINIEQLNAETSLLLQVLKSEKSQLTTNTTAYEEIRKKIDSLVSGYGILKKEVPTALESARIETALLKDENILLEKSAKELEKELDATAKTLEKGLNLQLGVTRDKELELQSQTESTRAAIEDVQNWTYTWREELQALAGDLVSAGGVLMEFGGFLDQLGSHKLGKTFSDIGGGIGSIGAGLEKATEKGAKWFDTVSGGLSILSGGISLATGIIDTISDWLSGDGIQEAIDRENDWMHLTKELNDTIYATAEAIGSVHAATSMHLAQIIKETEITATNFASYVLRMEEILCDFNRGTLSTAESAQAIGQSFTEILKNAKRLGLEGNKFLLSFLGNVRAHGLEVAEVQDYVNGKLNQVLENLQIYMDSFDTGNIQSEIDALNEKLADTRKRSDEYQKIQAQIAEKQLELAKATEGVTSNFGLMQGVAMSTFGGLKTEGYSFIEIIKMMGPQLDQLAQIARENGLEIDQNLQAMTNMSTFITQNQDLANQIEATRLQMEGLGDTAYLTQGNFEDFSAATVDQFNEIIARTGDQEMALNLIAPSLLDLVKYSESYGFTIDANTQALIDQAAAEGVLGEIQHTEQEKTNMLLEEILLKLGGKIPYAVDSLTSQVSSSVEKISSDTHQWFNTLDDVGRKIGELEGGIQDLDAVYTHHMTGNSIVPETEKWQDALNSIDATLYTIQGTIKVLDEEYVLVSQNLSDSTLAMMNTYSQSLAEMGRKNEELTGQLLYIESLLGDPSMLPGEIAELQSIYTTLVDRMNIDNIRLQDTINEIINAFGWTLPTELETLEEQYSWVMQQMTNSTNDLYLSTDGVLYSLQQILQLQGQVTAQSNGFGSQYGIYTDSEKEKMTADFYAMLTLWSDAGNRQNLLGNPEAMQKFYDNFQKLVVIDDDQVQEQYNYWLGSWGNWNTSVQAGKIWDEANRTWILPETPPTENEEPETTTYNTTLPPRYNPSRPTLSPAPVSSSNTYTSSNETPVQWVFHTTINVDGDVTPDEMAEIWLNTWRRNYKGLRTEVVRTVENG